jgi:hypothetical protein
MKTKELLGVFEKKRDKIVPLYRSFFKKENGGGELSPSGIIMAQRGAGEALCRLGDGL